MPRRLRARIHRGGRGGSRGDRMGRSCSAAVGTEREREDLVSGDVEVKDKVRSAANQARAAATTFGQTQSEGPVAGDVVCERASEPPHRVRDRELWAAEDVHALALSVLDGEYARITTSDEIIETLP